MAERLQVVAGILRDAAGRILITERTGDSPFAGLWEFPGGKKRAGESPSAALGRELDEELGIELLHCEPFMQLSHDYADRSVALEFLLVTAWSGEPSGREGQAIAWREPAAIGAGELLPADAPVLGALQQLQDVSGGVSRD